MPAQDDYESLSSLAERLGLDDKEKDSFVNSSMQRLGYKPRTSWEDGEDEDESKGGGDFFSGRRQQRNQRDVNRGGGSGRRDDRRASGGYDY